MLLLGGEERLDRGQIGQIDRLQLGRVVGRGLLELLLQLRPAAQAPIDLGPRQLLLTLQRLGGRALPAGEHGDDGTDEDQDRADRQEDRRIGEEAADRQRDPDDDDEQGQTGRDTPRRLRGVDLEVDVDLALEPRLEVADGLVESAEADDDLVQDRQRVR